MIKFWASEAEESKELAKHAKIELSPERQNDLIRITAFNLEARYPDYKKEFRKKCTPQFTTAELGKIDEVFQWLKSTFLP